VALRDDVVFRGSGFSVLKLQMQLKESLAKVEEGLQFASRGCRLMVSDVGNAGRLFARAATGAPKRLPALLVEGLALASAGVIVTWQGSGVRACGKPALPAARLHWSCAPACPFQDLSICTSIHSSAFIPISCVHSQAARKGCLHLALFSSTFFEHLTNAWLALPSLVVCMWCVS
jgi:hypothetical protein